MSLPRTLVTGGAGFIGSHLVKEGFEVCVVDDLSTGYRSHLDPGVPFYELDVCSDEVKRVFQEHRSTLVEASAHAFAAIRGIQFTILRYGNVHGPRQSVHWEAGVVAAFCRKMLDGEETTIYGDGGQERYFVYVGDVVRANMKALDQEESDVYNIGTGVAISINDLFGLVSSMADYQLPHKREPARTGDIYQTYLDVAKARDKLS